MEQKDMCAVCLQNMLRKNIKKLVPCNHLLHSACLEQLMEDMNDVNCPYCRQEVEGKFHYL